jgi:Rad3-related DNA helicase
MNYTQFFPFQEVREQQAQAIEFALDPFFKSNKNFCIIEMGTGGGNSAVAITISRYLSRYLPKSETHDQGAWFLTTQKMLQDQYIKDFGRPKGEMCSIKSSTNYQCNFFSRNSCAESLQLLKDADKGSRFYKSCSKDCEYRKAKRLFLDSSLSITNFPYFLTSTVYQEAFRPRTVIAIDEAHTIEDELSKFIEVTISERFASAMLGQDMPNEIDDQQKAIDWVRSKYIP